MKLEDQVCSLEPAKRLKELGVKQESLFYYINNLNWSEEIELGYYPELEWPRDENSISVFTVAELGELLPKKFYCKDEEKEVALVFYGDDNVKNIVSTFYVGEKGIYYQEATTEADARAKMLIYLIENKLIEV